MDGLIVHRWVRAVGRGLGPAGVLAFVLAAGPPAAAAAQDRPVVLDTLDVSVGSRSSARLPAASRAVTVIDADAIAAAPARTLADVLALSLGTDVQPRSPAQADVALRGATFEQVLVLVDGVRMSDAQTGHFDLDLAVPLAEIERIEILRGPATALYGSDAVGGVINVVTRRDGERLRFGIEGGGFGTLGAHASAAAGTDALRVRAGAEYRRADGHRPGTDYDALQTRLAVDAAVAGRTLRADFGFAARDFGARAFYTPPTAPYDEFEATRTATAAIALVPAAGARTSFEPRITARRHDDEFLLQRDDPDFYRNRHTNWQFGGELVARHTVSPTVRLVAGGEAYRDVLESNGLGDHAEGRGALFGEASFGHAGRAVAQVGVRTDWHSGFGTFLAPSAAVAVWASPALRVRASAGRSFRAPSWTDRYYSDPTNQGDPDLVPERAWEAELGADVRPAERVRFGAAAFLRRANGLIDWAKPVELVDDIETPWRTRNVQSATYTGLEFHAAADGALGADWRVTGSALRLRADDADGYVSRYALRPVTRSVTASVARALPRLAAGLSVSAVARYEHRDGSPEPALVDGVCTPGARQGHLNLDARIAYAWRGAHAALDVRNITGTKYCDVSAMPGPGRAAFLGISWTVGR